MIPWRKPRKPKLNPNPNLNLILNNSLIVKNKSIDVFWNSALSPLEKINSDSTILKTEPLNLIIKYCEKTNEFESNRSGYRPSQKYRFKLLKADIWI